MTSASCHNAFESTAGDSSCPLRVPDEDKVFVAGTLLEKSCMVVIIITEQLYQHCSRHTPHGAKSIVVSLNYIVFFCWIAKLADTEQKRTCLVEFRWRPPVSPELQKIGLLFTSVAL